MKVNLKKIAAFKEKHTAKYPDVYTYIDEKWFSGVFNKWQIYHNEPGFANSNSSVESFNNTIKKRFH